MLWIIIIASLFVLFLVYGRLSHLHFVTTKFEVTDARINKDYTFVMLSDLHCCRHGKEYDKLIKRIDEIHPDFIFIAGDMITKHDYVDKECVQRVLRLIQNISKKYSIYYAPGNHELRIKDTDRYFDEITHMGVRLMRNQEMFFPDDGIRVWGLELSHERFREKQNLTEQELGEYLNRDYADKDVFNILIAHDPRHFDAYADWGADLTMSGHYHGGVMRLPLLGGVVSPYLRLFPKYDAGLFEKNGKHMIVGRGLGSHHPKLRWFNPPELVVIRLNKGKQ